MTSQVRIGVGTFKHSTGITDSAYTHAVHEVIFRPPTAAELIGINRDEFHTILKVLLKPVLMVRRNLSDRSGCSR